MDESSLVGHAGLTSASTDCPLFSTRPDDKCPVLVYQLSLCVIQCLAYLVLQNSKATIMEINGLNICDITPENVDEKGVFCIKNKKAQGYDDKVSWFKDKSNEGLKIKVVEDENGIQLGFVEFTKAENAWRPVEADNYYFIHCIVVFKKEHRNKNIGSALLMACEAEARENGKYGLCTMTSNGPWIADMNLYVRNGFVVSDHLDRFELMYKSFDPYNPIPRFYNWTEEQKDYEGWHLVYADQCPWHEKSVTDLKKVAFDNDINLMVHKFQSPQEAKKAPSGYGTFSLLHDGKLLADHYISATRFKNIIKKELLRS